VKLTDVGLALAWHDSEYISVDVSYTLVAADSFDAASKRHLTVDLFGSDEGEPGGEYRSSPIWRFLFSPVVKGPLRFPIQTQFDEVTVGKVGPRTFQARNIIPGKFLDEDPDPSASQRLADEVYAAVTLWAGGQWYPTPLTTLASPTRTVPVFGARGT